MTSHNTQKWSFKIPCHFGPTCWIRVVAVYWVLVYTIKVDLMIRIFIFSQMQPFLGVLHKANLIWQTLVGELKKVANSFLHTSNSPQITTHGNLNMADLVQRQSRRTVLKQSLGELAGDHSNTPLFGYLTFLISMVSLIQSPQPFLYFSIFSSWLFTTSITTTTVLQQQQRANSSLSFKRDRRLVHQINVKLSITLT